ncbi:GNAT family N-acetyltransferase [Terrirubrum flagellatum]|uniref:GNAT family N-acetyltransferase n=1 Tax=Terrirubrum flagellatum TaxID=2895980 RepID=UPI003CC81CBF
MPLLRLRTLQGLPTVEGDGLFLRAPQSSDHAEWARLREESRAFLTPWEPTWPENDLSRAAFRLRVRRVADDMRADAAYAFLVTRASDGAILGGLTFSNVRRRVAQTGTLGYWVGAPHARRGYMTRAVRLALRFAFGTLALRRIEAACLPHNAASVRLLEKVGFTREGCAREYLQIAGRWQDHLLYAMLAHDFSGGTARSRGLQG